MHKELQKVIIISTQDPWKLVCLARTWMKRLSNAIQGVKKPHAIKFWLYEILNKEFMILLAYWKLHKQL
jgi:hypothetical protein